MDSAEKLELKEQISRGERAEGKRKHQFPGKKSAHQSKDQGSKTVVY